MSNPPQPPSLLRAPLIVAFVIAVALVGMVLGGAFGWAAGTVGPDLFRRMIPWEDYEPVGTAIVIGAFGGTMCGGALGVFAVIAQFAATWLGQRHAHS